MFDRDFTKFRFSWRRFLKVTVSPTRRLSDVAGKKQDVSQMRLELQISTQLSRLSINHRWSGTHLPASCSGELSPAATFRGGAAPSLRDRPTLNARSVRTRLNLICPTSLWLSICPSPHTSSLIRPQMAQFLGDHFGKSLGVNFATSMAVKSDWKISQK